MTDRGAIRTEAASAREALRRARIAFRLRWLAGGTAADPYAHLATPDARDVDYSQWLKHWRQSHQDAVIIHSVEFIEPPPDEPDPPQP